MLNNQTQFEALSNPWWLPPVAVCQPGPVSSCCCTAALLAILLRLMRKVVAAQKCQVPILKNGFSHSQMVSHVGFHVDMRDWRTHLHAGSRGDTKVVHYIGNKAAWNGAWEQTGRELSTRGPLPACMHACMHSFIAGRLPFQDPGPAAAHSVPHARRAIAPSWPSPTANPLASGPAAATPSREAPPSG